MVDRKQLDDIIMKNDTNDWWQPELFTKNTKYLLPPELEILADPPPEAKNYNCFLYAFGLHTDTKILKESQGFLYDTFVKQLLSASKLVLTEHPQDGDYIVYQDLVNYPSALTHIGVLEDDKVISKWAWGPLVKHDVWDVPESYGYKIFYVKAISNDTAKNLYRDFKHFNVHPNKSWLHPDLEIKDSLLGGKGLFATEMIPAGTVVLIWNGEYVGENAATEAKEDGKLVMQWDKNLFSVEDKGEDDAYFINHSCEPNVWMKDAQTLATRRDIVPGEELTADYALWEAHEEYVSAWECNCHSSACRGRVTGKDWKLPILQKAYRGHFSPLINKRIIES